MLNVEVLYRYIATLLILFVFFAQTFTNAIIVGNYYLNTSAYAKNCENKDKPWMHCNGKCQLSKQLQQENKKDQENPERKADNKNEITLSSKSFFASVHCPCNITADKMYILPRCIGNATDRAMAIFHPPQT
ncbi:MAG TPA: hypothetical protein VG738_23595 [Chitinophagaceae bacterium]|nr:hypothetical protein [Chitinophagaceae bacterium]